MKATCFTSMSLYVLLGMCMCLWGCSATSGRENASEGKLMEQQDKTVYYQSLSGTHGWNANVNVTKATVVANPDSVTAEFTIERIGEQRINKNLHELNDTIALVCLYNQVDPRNSILFPNILGVTHVHAKIAKQVNEGSLYPFAVLDKEDKDLLLTIKRGDTQIGIMGAIYKSMKCFFIWLLPNMPGTYDIVFHQIESKDRKVTVKLD